MWNFWTLDKSTRNQRVINVHGFGLGLRAINGKMDLGTDIQGLKPDSE